MGNVAQTTQKINFEDMQMVYKNPEIYLLINTLATNEQECLIKGTVHFQQEEALMNKYIRGNIKHQVHIVLYGKNSNDESVYKKYQQLISLGFVNVYMYSGGLFEWLMLQDIYGLDEFPTTSKQLDILKYKPCQRLHIGLIDN